MDLDLVTKLEHLFIYLFVIRILKNDGRFLITKHACFFLVESHQMFYAHVLKVYLNAIFFLYHQNQQHYYTFNDCYPTAYTSYINLSVSVAL
jgi:hypothetical protein